MTLQEYVDSLRGKRVAVLGIGVSNSPLIDLLLDNGLPITVCDMRDPASMEDEAEILSTRGAEVRLGAGYLDGLNGFDVIFRTPGLLPTDLRLAEAKAHGAQITSEMGGVFQTLPLQDDRRHGLRRQDHNQLDYRRAAKGRRAARTPGRQYWQAPAVRDTGYAPRRHSGARALQLPASQHRHKAGRSRDYQRIAEPPG